MSFTYRYHSTNDKRSLPGFQGSPPVQGKEGKEVWSLTIKKPVGPIGFLKYENAYKYITLKYKSIFAWDYIIREIDWRYHLNLFLASISHFWSKIKKKKKRRTNQIFLIHHPLFFVVFIIWRILTNNLCINIVYILLKNKHFLPLLIPIKQKLYSNMKAVVSIHRFYY